MSNASHQQNREVGELGGGMGEEMGREEEVKVEGGRMEEECGGLQLLASEVFDNDLREFLREVPQPM